MATAQDVFGVTELLEAIIVQLPHTDILTVCRVAKNWQSLTDSDVWDDIVDPPPDPKKRFEYRYIDAGDEVDGWVCGFIKLHPALPVAGGHILLRRNRIVNLRELTAGVDFQLDQYISDPPISVLPLKVSRMRGYVRVVTYSDCSLRVATGITFGDLLEMEKKLIEAVPASVFDEEVSRETARNVLIEEVRSGGRKCYQWCHAPLTLEVTAGIQCWRG